MGDILTTIAEFIGKVPEGVWDFLPGLGLPGWLAWLPKIGTGLGALTIFTRLIPDNWLYKPITQFFDKAGMVCAVPLFALGKAISEGGRRTLGKKWERVEEQVFEKAIMLFFRAVFDGMSLFIQRVRNAPLDGMNMDDPGVGNIH